MTNYCILCSNYPGLLFLRIPGKGTLICIREVVLSKNQNVSMSHLFVTVIAVLEDITFSRMSLLTLTTPHCMLPLRDSYQMCSGIKEGPQIFCIEVIDKL